MPSPVDQASAVDVAAPGAPGRRLPGSEGIWVFLLIDLTFFVMLFVAFGTERASDPALFDEARSHLYVGLGLLNMVVLLTSSWLAALAVHAVRSRRPGLARRLLWSAAACGVTFLAVKALEYTLEVQSGAAVGQNQFITLYFVMTGLHAIHVLAGVVVLLICARGVRRRSRSRGTTLVESGTLYWHMVDLLWIFIFVTLYGAA